ncbi:hypothetical protein B0F90DRAFT_1035893 [Multifurca ochricompacta]|uniref:Uncharacterized protein n=1 Tax=Multifurca ochricompacta TaxID=376703 RepID=A0AAD4LZL9_9AGAM|nr:hypothetical protein B0F90DRAFT_1035893 [Multifurca ochricompacta]
MAAAGSGHCGLNHRSGLVLPTPTAMSQLSHVVTLPTSIPLAQSNMSMYSLSSKPSGNSPLNRTELSRFLNVGSHPAVTCCTAADNENLRFSWAPPIGHYYGANSTTEFELNYIARCLQCACLSAMRTFLFIRKNMPSGFIRRFKSQLATNRQTFFGAPLRVASAVIPIPGKI